MEKTEFYQKKRFRISMFTILVLVLLLFLIVKSGDKAEAVLFHGETETTLYAKTAVGTEPQLNAAKFFPDEKLEPSKFSYDMTDFDSNTLGTYRIPVLYDERLTNCVIELEVFSEKTEQPVLSGGDDGTSLENGEEQ